METRRLRRQVRALTTLVLAVLFLVGVLALKKPDSLTQTKYYNVQGTQGPQGIAGIGLAGKDGVSVVGPPGANGRDGIDGKDGVDGAPGKDGTDGQDGKTTEFRTNPSTCDIEYRYIGDRTWTVLVEQECDNAGE